MLLTLSSIDAAKKAFDAAAAAMPSIGEFTDDIRAGPVGVAFVKAEAEIKACFKTYGVDNWSFPLTTALVDHRNARSNQNGRIKRQLQLLQRSMRSASAK